MEDMEDFVMEKILNVVVFCIKMIVFVILCGVIMYIEMYI